MANSAQGAETKKRGKVRRWFKDLFGELKKVSWPTLRETVKQTGVVIAVVLFFIVIVCLFDLGMGWLYDKLSTNLTVGNPITWLIRGLLRP
ncbi:MAG: preprotein translocase subunit SecE [Firmicutes bacterium]|nr:preprotein translocase subunit SecE [Bacillota bacterium]